MEENLDQMPLAELGSLPDNAVPAGTLTAIWSRRVSLVQQRNAEELAREQDPNYTGPRFLTTGNASVARERQQHEKFIRDYEQAMDDIRTRSDALLAQIEDREQQDREHLRQIEQNAIHLRDGRAVYVDHDQYRDEQGNILAGVDATEADQLHKQKPDASSWAQKEKMQKQYDDLKRLKSKVQRQHDDAKDADGASLSDKDRAAKLKDAQDQLSEDEKELNRQVATADGAHPSQENITDDTYGGSDYLAAYGRRTSVAAAVDGSNTKSLTGRFTPAATGEGVLAPSTGAPKTAPSRVGANPKS